MMPKPSEIAERGTRVADDTCVWLLAEPETEIAMRGTDIAKLARAYLRLREAAKAVYLIPPEATEPDDLCDAISALERFCETEALEETDEAEAG